MSAPIEFLTQREAADRLRRSVRHIERLRAAGEIEYLPGHPVMIPVAGLEAYIARKTCRARIKARTSGPAALGDMKYAGQTMDDRTAAQRAHRIFSRLKKS